MKPNRNSRPKLHRVSPDTQAYSSILMAELRSWPDVSDRPMFGFQGFYRDSKIFAALPKTRSIARHGFIFKLTKLTPELRARLERDPRVDLSGAKRWLPFDLADEKDLDAALRWLEVAYEAAGASRKRATKKGPRGPS